MAPLWKSAGPLFPEISVEIGWTSDPADDTPTWTPVTDRLRHYSARLYRQSELDEFQTGEFYVVLDNDDRELEPGYSGSSLYPNVKPRKRIRVQARHGGVTYDRVGGFIRSLPVTWPGQKDATVTLVAADFGMALNRAQVTIDGYPQELAHVRIGRVLDEIGVAAADRNLDTSTHTLAAIAAQVEGQAARTVGALEHARQAALSDGGYLFCSRDGKVVFHNREHRRDIETASRITFGDAAGEAPYRPSLVAQMDDARLWNRAAVIGADGFTREEAVDTTSETDHWPSRRDDFASELAYPGEMAALASLLVWRYKDPRLRFPQIAVSANSSDTDTDMVSLLEADVGHRFTLRRRPPGGGSAIDEDVHVEGITEDVIPGSWEITFDVAAADVDLSGWVLGTSALNSTAVVSY